MARYIDVELLLNALKEERKNGNFVFTSKWIKEIMYNLPTADVAQKSEVIDEILSLIDDKIRFEVEVYNGFNSLNNGKTLCQERVNALNDLKLIINHQFRAELKKKYTEGKE